MRRVLDRLGAGLGPFHRALGDARQRRHQVVLGIWADLAAEPAAHVGRDDAHLAFLQPHRPRDEQADEVGVLARHPDRELLVKAFVVGAHAAWLHGHGRQPVLENALLHHDICLFERRLGDVGPRVCEIPADVVRPVHVRLRAALLERLLEVHHRWQILVFDLDQVGRVGRLALGLGEHSGDDLALIGDFFLGDRKSLRDKFLLGDKGRRGRMRPGEQALEVARRVDADHARSFACVCDVDALDARVREGAAHEMGVCRALPREVVDVVPMASDETRIFAAVDLGPDQLGDRHVSCLPP